MHGDAIYQLNPRLVPSSSLRSSP